jgi:hypothetical protein
MDRRPTLLSSILIFLLSSISSAQDTPLVEDHEPTSAILSERIDLSISDLRYVPTDDFLDSVTMRTLPEGSLYTRFDGLHSVVMRQLRSQGRRFVRQAIREGWYVDDETISSRPELLRRVDRGVDPLINGAWWNRRWWESLPEEKGGAPAVPRVQTFGCETSWRLGPITATNTLRLRFDYLAFFEVDPDPIEPDHPERVSPVALDVRPLDEHGLFGHHFRVDVRPRLQIGLPTDANMTGLIRGVSLQVSFEVWTTRQKVVKGDVAVRWRPEDGISASFEVALASW